MFFNANYLLVPLSLEKGKSFCRDSRGVIKYQRNLGVLWVCQDWKFPAPYLKNIPKWASSNNVLYLSHNSAHYGSMNPMPIKRTEQYQCRTIIYYFRLTRGSVPVSSSQSRFLNADYSWVTCLQPCMVLVYLLNILYFL